MNGISEKQAHLTAGKKSYFTYPADFQAAITKALEQIRDENILNRIWAHDPTVWEADAAEIIHRLGWLHSPDVMVDAIPELTSWVEEVRSAGYTQALLLGMGGSSLAPEMFRFTFGVKAGFLDLAVLDSTDPGAVLEYAETFEPEKTLYIVSTKSGGTVETLSFMKYFYNQVFNALGQKSAGDHFIAITDPGSSLNSIANQLNFRKIFLNDPNIGGRYSALSFFGLVPAALIGMDLSTLLERAATMACNCEGCNCPVGGNNSAAWLGTIIGTSAKMGRDKLTLVTSPPISHFGAWVEQLIAESTGKNTRGILPVEGEQLLAPDNYSQDRLFVYLRLENDDTYDAKIKQLADAGFPVIQINLGDLYDLGAEIFRWEMATVVAGKILEINPFDQPNVESAKVIARQKVADYQKEGKLPEFKPILVTEGIGVYADFSAESLDETFDKLMSYAKIDKDASAERSYIAIQAYVKPTVETSYALLKLRTKLQIKYKMATTVGYGPRFLHSTGQLHKGDGGNGLFIQITADMPKDAPIPDQAGQEASFISFGVLKTAQALGDHQALVNAGRHVIRFHIEKDVVGGIHKLIR
ncbi:MAG: hypothetical protein JW786_15235 [Desulfobacterales bacterium]|nr:hypothetical protein [Desulfobacterales bacterium]